MKNEKIKTRFVVAFDFFLIIGFFLGINAENGNGYFLNTMLSLIFSIIFILIYIELCDIRENHSWPLGEKKICFMFPFGLKEK